MRFKRYKILYFVFLLLLCKNNGVFAQQQLPSIVQDYRSNLRIVRVAGSSFEFNLTLDTLVNAYSYEVKEVDTTTLPIPTLLADNFTITTTPTVLNANQVVLHVSVDPGLTPAGNYCFGVYVIDRSGICASDISIFNVTLITPPPRIAYDPTGGRYDTLYVSHDSIGICHNTATSSGYELPLKIDAHSNLQSIFEAQSVYSYSWRATSNSPLISGLRGSGFQRTQPGVASPKLNIQDTLITAPKDFHGVITYQIQAAYKYRPGSLDSLLMPPYTYTVIIAPDVNRRLSVASNADSVCVGSPFTLTFSDITGIPFGNGFGIRLYATSGETIDTFLTSSTFTHTPMNSMDIAFTYYIYDSLTQCEGPRRMFVQKVNPTTIVNISGGTNYVFDSIRGDSIFFSLTECPGSRLIINPATFVQGSGSTSNFEWNWTSNMLTGVTYHDTIQPMQGIIGFNSATGTYTNIQPAGNSAIHYLDRDNTMPNNDQTLTQTYTIYTSQLSASSSNTTSTNLQACSIIHTNTGTGIQTLRDATIIVNVRIKPKPGLQLRFSTN